MALTNATAYYVSFQTDIELGTVVLNYTVIMSDTSVGELFGIFLSFSRTPQVEAIFGFDNNLRTKDYISTRPDFNVTGDIRTFQESIYIRSSVPDELFLPNQDVTTFGLDLTTVVFGSGTGTTFEIDSEIFFTVNRPPGEFDACV